MEGRMDGKWVNLDPQNNQDNYTGSPISFEPKCLQTTAVRLVLGRC